MTIAFKCKLVDSDNRWQCTYDDGTKTWYAGPDYRWEGKLASEAKLINNPDNTKPLTKTAADWIKAVGIEQALKELAEDFYQTQSPSLPPWAEGSEVPPPLPTPEPPLPNDGRPQDKGANQDARTWLAIQMKDDLTMWKVTDDKGINVADQFHSVENAQGYIDHYVYKQAHAPPTPEVPPSPEPGTSLDKYGIQIIAPMKQGGVYHDVFSYKDSVHNTGPRDTWSREIGPVTNICMVGYWNINLSDDEEELSNKPLGGGHSGSGDNSGTRQGKCYAMGVQQNGGPNFKKEYPHHSTTPDFSKKVTFFDPNFKSLGSIKDKTIGMMNFCFVNKAEKWTELQCWVDTSGVAPNGKPYNKWRPFWKVRDTGQLVGPPYLENNGIANGGKGMYYMRIDQKTRKSMVYGQQVYEITALPKAMGGQ